MKINSGIKPSPRRILLYGIHGVGKSTWAKDAPKPLFLNLENGLDDIDCDKTDLLKTYSEVIEALHWVRDAPHDYKTLAADTLDWLEQIIFRQICQQNGVETVNDIDFGKGFPKAIPMWKHVLETLDEIRNRRKMNIILLAHAKIEKFKNPEGSEYDRYSPDLWTNSRNEGVSNMIQEWCDEVLFASFKVFTTTDGKGFNQKTIARGGKERYIRTSESASCMAKNRIGLPEEMPMEWAFYADIVKQKYSSYKQATVANVTPIEPTVEQAPKGMLEGLVVDGSSKVKQQQEELVAATNEVF